ncbi:MAG: hypothetical protein Q8P05_06330 [Candidatus Diapherotrites archaeon]|nr:hypothetical protein [Candidatus Diapherotrites archaeon]
MPIIMTFDLGDMENSVRGMLCDDGVSQENWVHHMWLHGYEIEETIIVL